MPKDGAGAEVGREFGDAGDERVELTVGNGDEDDAASRDEVPQRQLRNAGQQRVGTGPGCLRRRFAGVPTEDRVTGSAKSRRNDGTGPAGAQQPNPFERRPVSVEISHVPQSCPSSAHLWETCSPTVGKSSTDRMLRGGVSMESSIYLRAVTPVERAYADERITLSEQARFIDADEAAGRRAHLTNVRTVGELAAVVDDLPDLGDLRQQQTTTTVVATQPAWPGAHAAQLAPAAPMTPGEPGDLALWSPGDAPAPRKVRLPLTSPGREDAPPPDLPLGPYGDQFAHADPRGLSHRVVTRVVPTAWGPTWQTTVVRQTNRYAVASLTLGICGVMCGATAPIGVVTGHMALSQIKKSDLAFQQGTVAAVGEQPQEGRGLAIAGLITSYAITVTGLVLLVWMVIVLLQEA